jgi:Bcr/CflA subfamily drug resistance transporter
MNIKNEIVLLFVILLISIGQSVDVYLPSMPAMISALHTSATLIQLSITIGLIGYGLTALIYGPLADYFGRRIIALVGLAIFTFGSIFCLFAANIYLLLLGRLLQGMGFASACGVAAPATNDVYAGDELVKAYSYIGMAIAITPVVAPVLGGYLQHYINWHAPFAFLFLYGLVIFLLFWNFFPETKKVLYQGSIHPVQIAKSYLNIMTSRRYFGFILCLIFIFAGEISYVITAPFLLQTKLGVTPIANGWLILATVGGYLIGAFSSSRLCKIWSTQTLLLIGSLFAIFGAILMFALSIITTMSIVSIIAPMVLYMLGAGLIYPSAIGGCMSIFPESTGSVSALAAMFQQLCGGLIATMTTHLHLTTQLPLAGMLMTMATLTLASLYFGKILVFTNND